MNKDDITARIIVDWDSNGYRTTTTALHYDIDSEVKLTMKDVKLTYSYSNMQ